MEDRLIYKNAVLKFTIDFMNLLICTEGTRLLRDQQVRVRPRSREAGRRLTDRPRKAKCLECKSTALSNTAIKNMLSEKGKENGKH
jgi:hypothetical protein